MLVLLFSTLFYANAQSKVSLIVTDISATSTVTGEELSILLTKETFKCTANIEFHGINATLYDTQELFSSLDTNDSSTTLYYSLTANDATVDAGSIVIAESDYTLLSSIESNEISIHKTGDIELAFHVSFDESFYDKYSDETYSGYLELYSITGFTTLVPLIFVVFFVLAVRNVYVSLYLAIWIGSFIMSGCSFRYAFEMSVGTYILNSCASSDHQFVILFCVFLSGLVFLIQHSGGTQGFSTLMRRLAKTAKRTQFATFLAGLLIFFSDYANALVVGTAFQPLTDIFHISREKLAFLVDATSAPVASIVPLSGWIGFELQQIQQQLDAIKENNHDVMPHGLTDNAFVFFIETIPTRFYPIYLLMFQITIMALSIEFGPMLRAERLVRVDQRTDGGRGKSTSNSNDDGELHNGAEPAKDTPGRWWNMLIPIITLIVLILAVVINTGVEGVQEEGVEMTARNIFANSSSWKGLLYGTFAASMVTVALYMVQFKHNGSIVPPSMPACKHCLFKSKDAKEDIAVPLMTFPEAIETWVAGIAFMSSAVSILILVWAIGAVMTDIGADRYFTRILMQDDVDPSNLPTIVFILAALISATTGTSWGTMTIMFPLVSPAAWAICAPLDNGVALYTATMSQILSGSIFGDHSSPLSDTTLLSSVASGCDLFRHVWTQLPYASWVAFFAIICGTLMVGDGVAAGVCIVVGLIVQTVCTWLVGAPVIAKSGRYDVFTELYILCLSKCKSGKEDEDVELIVLRRKTVEFVRSGQTEDLDFVMKFLSLTGLNALCDKCGTGIDDGEKRHNQVEMEVTEQVALNITADNETNIVASVVSEEEENGGHGDQDLL